MSVVSYNGVTLPYAYITQFQQEAMYDELGGTDYYCTKYEIMVEAMISHEYLVLMFPTLVGRTENAAVVMAAVRDKLLVPRKKLSIKFNGVELLPGSVAINDTTGIDAKNGPKPKSCLITQLTNSLFIIHYHIIAHYWSNPLVSPGNNQDEIVMNQRGNPVLYNRWTEIVDYDKSQYATRTREGKIVIRSDNDRGFTADEVRNQMAVVSVPDGFLRDKSTYRVDPTGLGLHYTIVDREVFKKPPNRAFEADGHYYETAVQPGGAQRWGEARVMLKGDKITGQVDLINTAIEIAAAKLRARGVQLAFAGVVDPVSQFILHFGACRIGLYDNWVDVVLRGMLPASGRRVNGIAAFSSMGTFTPGSDGVQYTPRYFNRGTSNLLLQAAAYYDPSLRNTELGEAPNAGNLEATTTGTTRINLTAGKQPGRVGLQGE